MNQNSPELKQRPLYRSSWFIVGISALIALTVGFFVWFFLYEREPEPGALNFDSSVSAEAREFVTGILSDLTADVNISSSASTTRREPSDTAVLYSILVPVADPNCSKLAVTAEEFNTMTPEENGGLISFWDLTPEVRLLAVDNEYYLDTFDSGARFLYLEFSSENYEVAKSSAAQVNEHIPDFPTKDEILSLAQTGVTALSRGMFTKLQQVGNAGFFAESIGPYLSSFDFTHTSNEASFSTQAHSQNICSTPAMIDTLTAIGLDIVELTGNHNIDCGDNDARSTIATYNSLSIRTFGGGVSAAAAAIPLEISAKNTNLTLLGYNLSTGGYTTDDTPGANFYTEEKAAADITTAKAKDNFVIVDVQYYECNEYVFTTENTTCDYANSAAGDQIGLFRHLIDLGADIVVGTSAHQPQTFEKYGNGMIYYGLGNLFFDQSWWPGTTRSLILGHYFYAGKLIQTRLAPTIYDHSYQTRLLPTADAEIFISRLQGARP